MKTTNLLTAACTALLMLAACTADELTAPQPIAPDTPGVTSFTASMGRADGPDTRLVYEENDKTSTDGNSRGITLKWSPGDVIYLQKHEAANKNQLHKYVFTGNASTEGTFSLAVEEGNTPLTYADGNTNYNIFAITDKSSFKTSGPPYINLSPTTSLTQDCGNPMAHLSTPSLMSAQGTITEADEIHDADGGLVLRFKPLLAMVSFDIKLPQGEIPTKVWLHSSGGTQLLSSKQIYASNLQPTPVEESFTSQLLLNILNATSNTITTHFLLIPQDLSAADLHLEVETQTGTCYKGTAFKGANFEAGKHYTATTAQTGGTDGWTVDVIDYTLADANDPNGSEPPAENTSKDPSPTNPYLISTAAHLRWLVLNANTVINRVFHLQKNIHIADDVMWTPIGQDASTYFRSSFDGCGHTVTGLRTDPNKDYQGFFGYTGKTIKNLHILNGQVKGTKNVGGIVGYMSAFSISDCTFSGTVEATASSARLGGIVGQANGDINRCVNTGNISSTQACYAGGIVGLANNPVCIVACSNTGKVEASNSSWGTAGGIVGYSATSQLYACYSTVAALGGKYQGGIFGQYVSTHDFDNRGCFYLPPQTGGNTYKGMGYKFDNINETTNPDDIPGGIEQVADIPALNAQTGTVANPAAGTLNAGIRAWVAGDNYRYYEFHFVPGGDANTPPRLEWGEPK